MEGAMIRAVSDLGDLLVLLHGARARISTVRANARGWRHERRVCEAMERSTRGGSVAGSLGPHGSSPMPLPILSRRPRCG
jgi:hypothetical protein